MAEEEQDAGASVTPGFSLRQKKTFDTLYREAVTLFHHMTWT